MKRNALFALTAIAMLASPLISTAQEREVNSVDRRFVQQAVNASDMEIFEARAMVHSRDARVVRYANMIIKDHTLANSQIGALASSKAIPFSHRTTQELNEDFNKMRGPSVSPSAHTPRISNAAYMRAQVADHQKAIKLFESEKANGGSTEFKTLAANLLPALEKHLRMAQSYTP